MCILCTLPSIIIECRAFIYTDFWSWYFPLIVWCIKTQLHIFNMYLTNNFHGRNNVQNLEVNEKGEQEMINVGYCEDLMLPLYRWRTIRNTHVHLCLYPPTGRNSNSFFVHKLWTSKGAWRHLSCQRTFSIHGNLVTGLPAVWKQTANGSDLSPDLLVWIRR